MNQFFVESVKWGEREWDCVHNLACLGSAKGWSYYTQHLTSITQQGTGTIIIRPVFCGIRERGRKGHKMGFTTCHIAAVQYYAYYILNTNIMYIICIYYIYYYNAILCILYTQH